ncbi:hypothetical protein CLAIMM_12133 isoform 1 [Cladophialophora immunda]|nr:hypothetical protein CLAIMM_12133 isoform 1 [Cladophialophora immunda]
MIFAFQKLQQRQGKDTAFLIRGQTRSRKDVEHYWKRCRLDPASLSPVPNTPDGMEYRTPSPSPGREVGEAGSKDTAQEDADSSPFVEDEDIAAVFQYINQDLIFTPRSTILRLLDSPEQLQPLDQALHYAKVLFQWHVESANPDRLLVSQREAGNVINKFENYAFNALVAIICDLSHPMIATGLLDTLAYIPKVAKYDCWSVMMVLLRIVVSYAAWVRCFTSRMIKMAIHEIMIRVVTIYGAGHPVPLVLRAVIRSFEVTSTISEMVFLAEKDMVGRALGYDHHNMETVLENLCAVQYRSDHSNAALKCANELHRLALRRHRRDMTQDSLLSLLDAKLRMSQFHLDLDDFEEAEVWIENGLQTCSEIKHSATRDSFQSTFSYDRGLLMMRSGQWSAAFETFGKVIDFRMRWWGAGDAHVISAARSMKLILRWQAEEAQRLSAAQGDNQNRRPESTCVAGQEESGINRLPESLGDEEPPHVRVNSAEPLNDGDSHLSTSRVDQQPWTIGHVEGLTDEQPHQQAESPWDGQMLEPAAEEGLSWMTWSDQDTVEWIG